jgi:hypothetical protein
MAYAGYQGYDPELDRLKQRRNIAEALQQGALETGPKSLPEGIAQIGKALIARQAMKKANKAGDAYKSNQDRIADLFVSQMFPGDAAAMAYPESPAPSGSDASAAPMPSQSAPRQTPQGGLGALMPKAPQPAAAPSVAPAQPQAMPGAMTPRPPRWSIPDPGMAALGQATPPAGAMQPQVSAAPMAARGGFTPQQQQAGSDAAQVRAMIAMGMNPMEAAAAVKGEQRQRSADALAADERNYARGRDAVGDQRWNTEFDYRQGRDETDDEYRERVLGETVRGNKANERIAGQELDLKRTAAEAEASGDAIFDGSQLATIYNKGMTELDEVKARQGDLDTIAGASTQFMDVVKGDDWLQGAGFFNDLMQAGSTRTSEAKKLTDTIAPLIRRPGSGGNSDADVTMFKNSVVNVNNTPQSNKLATEQAVALQQRGQQYVNFLTRSIDPRDPQSKQKADAMWNIYKQENSLFDPQSGKVKAVPAFDDWLAVKMGKGPPVNSFIGKRVQAALPQAPTGATASDASDDEIRALLGLN